MTTKPPENLCMIEILCMCVFIRVSIFGISIFPLFRQGGLESSIHFKYLGAVLRLHQ